MKKRISINLKGQAQGMGLRPQIHRMARAEKLTGFVKNNLSGVHIEVQGDRDSIQNFIHSFSDWYESATGKKPFAEIKEIDIVDDYDFQIMPSETVENSFYQDIPRDTAICPECLHEMNSKADKRSEFLFNACTKCGPRYSVFSGFPLDRKNTSWKNYSLCESCRSEYGDSQSIRFHAQNISCPECGPVLEFKNESNEIVYKNIDAVKEAAKAILNGKIIAVKSTSGVHLVCRAENELQVLQLRKIKGRYMKPFAVMYRSIEDIENQFPDLTAFERKLLLSKASPIVIVKGIDQRLAESVSAGISFTGCILPYNSIYYLLMQELNHCIVVTSANESDLPLTKNINEISSMAETYSLSVLNHDLEIQNTADDSVIRFADGHPLIIRNGRGLAPLHMQLSRENRNLENSSGDRKNKYDDIVFCAGADLKNAFAFRRGGRLILSPYMGNITNEISFENYRKAIKKHEGYYNFSAYNAVCDMHPGYLTSQYAESLGVPLIKVQHHHAHCMALMAEHNLTRDSHLLCAAFDGTGFGTDGNIWGGEIMLASYSGFQRIAHLRYFNMPGQDSAVQDGYRIALFLLFEMYGGDAERMLPFDPEEVSENRFLNFNNFYHLWKNDQSVQSSSAGRLFDAAASLLGILHRSSYEGQSGLFMESLAGWGRFDPYGYTCKDGILDWREMIEALLKEKDKSRGARRFMDTLAVMAVDAALPFGKLGLTGGVFQNSYMIKRIKELAEIKKMELYIHRILPPNDGNIAAGQAAFICPE